MSSNTLFTVPFFSPIQIPNCAVWLDGLDPNGTGFLPANNSTLSTWVDKSTFRNNATASGTTGVFQLNSFNTQYPSIFFNPTKYSGTYPTNTGTTLTGFYVGRASATNGNYQRFLSLSRPGVSDFSQSSVTAMLVTSSDGNKTFRTERSGSVNTDYSTSIVQNVIANVIFDGTNCLFYANGSLVATNASSGSFNITQYSVGAGTQDAAQIYGNIAEVIFYNSALTTTQRQQIEGYLAWKWGLQNNLPANHPYRNQQVPSIYALPPQFQSIGTVPLGPSSSPFTFFTPRSISNLATWLDATDVSTLYSDSNATTLIASNGSAVRYWRDKSTNANDVRVSASSNAPTYQAGSFNSQAALQLNNGYFNAVNLSKISSQNASIFAFYRSSSSNTAPVIYALGNGEFAMYPTYYLHRHPNNPDNGVSITDTYQPVVGEILYNNSNLLYFNNFNNVSPVSPTLSVVSNVFYNTWFNVGTYQNGVGYNPQMFIGEIIIYNSLLSTGERQQVEGYLAWKWGLVGNLPSNHPFKNAPPGLSIPVVPQSRQLGNRVFGPLGYTTGLSIWYDGSDPNGNGTPPANGTSQAIWVDKSGNGKNTSSTSAPTFSAASLNGLGTLRFNGASGTAYFLTLPSFDFGTSQRTVFFVMTNTGPSSGAGSSPIIFWPLTGNGTNSLSFDSWFRANVQGQSYGATATFVKNQYYIISYRFGNTTAYEEIYGNGTLAATNTKTTGGSSYANATSGYRLGWIEGEITYTYALDGNIGEVLLYNRALTDSQRQTVEGYLAWKWGLQGNLPNNHPFKKWPPPPS